MKARRTRAFRPWGETMEQRLPTAAIPSLRAILAERAAALRARRAENPWLRGSNNALRPVPGRTPGVTAPGPKGPSTPGVGAGFLGNQGGRLNGRPTPPAANVNYGLVTIKNATLATVTFSVSASTYQGGAFHDFTLAPGQSQVYYARYGGPLDSAPSFQVSFDIVERRDVTQLAEVNSVYASSRWVPTDVSQGRPYEIVSQAGRLTVVPAD
jgi:hypothetical protein